MKNNKYIVTFTNGKTVYCSCTTEEQAEILAKAVMIKNGLTMEVSKVTMVFTLAAAKTADYAA